MLNVFGVGRGRKKVSDEGSTADNETLVAPPPVSPGQLRLQKGTLFFLFQQCINTRKIAELSTLDLSDHFTLLFPDKNDFMSFVVEVTPDTGIWQVYAALRLPYFLCDRRLQKTVSPTENLNVSALFCARCVLEVLVCLPFRCAANVPLRPA